MNHPTATGVQILYHVTLKAIDFFEINSPKKGNGGKMVEAILTDFPLEWQPAVIMDWSDGFWVRMSEKNNHLEWIL